MTRVLAFALVCLAVLSGGMRPVAAATFPLSDGTTLEGDPISFNAQGLVVKRADGTFADRVGWTNLTQEALKELSKQPKAKPFVEPYLEVDEPEPGKKPSLEIKPRPVKRLDRPDPKAGFGSIFASRITVVLLIALWLGNVYAGYEISVFRNYPPGVVCLIAAVAPVLGPVVFLCLPTRIQKSHADLAAESMTAHLADAPQKAGYSVGQRPGPGEAAGAEAAAEAAPGKPKTTVYQRGQTTFNRRFFETKFAGFLRMVPGEAEKNMVIYIRSARGEHVGSRLTRIMPSEVCLQVAKGEATAEVIIPFTEIYEIQVRPKEA